VDVFIAALIRWEFGAGVQGGGPEFDKGAGIAVDTNCNIYVTDILRILSPSVQKWNSSFRKRNFYRKSLVTDVLITLLSLFRTTVRACSCGYAAFITKCILSER